MSDTQSQQSSKSQSSNRNRTKICAYDGKVESSNYFSHARAHHGGVFTEWVQDEPLKGEAWCINWQEFITNPTATPVGVLLQFQRGAGKQYSQKGSVSGSVRAPSQRAQSVADDGEMENTNQEEEKAVLPNSNSNSNSNFGALEQITQKPQPKSTSGILLGKRVPSAPCQLEGTVLEEVYEPSAPPIIQAKRSNVEVAKLSAKSLNNLPKLSAKSLNNLPQASFVQKQQTLEDEGEFLAPFSVFQTVYISQGMRDQQAIQKLIALERQTTGLAQVRAIELIKLAPMFSQQTVRSYIELNKDQLRNIRDLLLQAYDLAGSRSIEEISAIAFASVLFGDSVWAALPKMLNSLEASKLDGVLSLLSPLLVNKLGQSLTQWICKSWRYLEGQTLGLLRYLKAENLEDTLSASAATISTMVWLEDITKYLTVIDVFSDHPFFQLMLDNLATFAPQWKSEHKLSFEEFVALVTFLFTTSNSQLVKANQEDLYVLPLKQWMQKLTTLQSASNICDVDSVQHRLNQLCELYGPLLKSHTTDLCFSGDTRYKRILHQVTNPPNALQFANAQYSAFSLRDRSRQLWCIPSGQGKSRVLAAITLILLLTCSTTKVHLVFDSIHLMQRDKREFSHWFILNQRESMVEHHSDLDFECQPGDIVLVDEADDIILSNPAKFSEKIQNLKCICLTATPDNNDNKGVEREVLKHLGFSIFDGQSTVPIASESHMKTIKPMDAALGPQLIQAIQRELNTRAVLCYCSPEFQQLLARSSISPTIMKDGETIDDEFLRTLDNTGLGEQHELIITSSLFGMRGFDYRAPRKGITLIIAASFSNQREAMQAMARVCRHGDPGDIFLVRGVALIDKEKELIYAASLVQFLNSHQKQKVLATLPKEERKRQTTAKSTPVVAKSRRGQQQNSSQTTLTTGAFGTVNLNKKQTKLNNAVMGAAVKNLPPQKKDEMILFGDKEEEEEEKIDVTQSLLQ